MNQPEPARILLVDDEPVVRHIVERALSSSYNVLTLSSSENLEQQLLPFRPDLVILDVNMPGEDGWTICSKMRQKKRFDYLPIVFLSSLSDEVSVRKSFASGGDFYLPKPFTLKELLRMVEIFLGRKHRHPDDSLSI